MGKSQLVQSSRYHTGSTGDPTSHYANGAGLEPMSRSVEGFDGINSRCVLIIFFIFAGKNLPENINISMNVSNQADIHLDFVPC